jgi:hypothetical protein
MLQNPTEGTRKAIKKFLSVVGRKYEMEIGNKSKRKNTKTEMCMFNKTDRNGLYEQYCNL